MIEMDKLKENINYGNWISVKDKMPDNEQLVLAYTPVDGYMFVGFQRTYHWSGGDYFYWYIVTARRSTKQITKRVTHWMPLPIKPLEDD